MTLVCGIAVAARADGPPGRASQIDIGEPPVPIGTPGQVTCDADYQCPGVTVNTAPQLTAALAAAQPGTVIEIRSDIRLDQIAPVRVPLGVTLQGTRGARRRGALLYLNRPRPGVQSAFEIRGDGRPLSVTIRGLRLRGPSASHEKGPPRVAGILLRDNAAASIARNELFQWTDSAVKASGGIPEADAVCRRPPLRRPRVTVANNYLHHNQQAGAGYGVSVRDGAFAVIFGNTFDFNRHAVAGDGHAQSGYFARHNYVLEGGHTYTYSNFPAWDQHFDMHGDDNVGEVDNIVSDGTDNDDGDGGHAGDFIELLGNTIHGEQRPFNDFGRARRILKLRGRPCNPSQIRGNVVVHEKGEVASGADGGEGQFELIDNDYNTDTSRSLAVGEFDRDGRDDLFQATGAAWYYSSGGATEWRLLQADRTETTNQLGLGDFDGDGDTDVLKATGRGWLISASGTEPWQHWRSSRYGLDAIRFGDFDGNGSTDAFRADGSQWWYAPGAAGRWQPLARSAQGVNEVRFGFFDGNATTDVFTVSGDEWAVRYGGSSRWDRLNNALVRDLATLVLADFDGDAVTDVANSHRGYAGRHDPVRTRFVEWRISRSGRDRTWNRLRNIPNSAPLYGERSRAHLFNHWIGHFDGRPGADALRYEPIARPTRGAFDQETTYLVRSSGARGADYVAHSRNAMR